MMGYDTARFGDEPPYRNYRSSEARTPENGYVGLNTTGYMNPELDSLIERFLITIPQTERVQLAAQIVHHLTDQVIPHVMFFDIRATAVGRRLHNVVTTGNELWNVHLWDVS